MKKGLAEGIVYQIFPDRFFTGNGVSVNDKLEKGLFPEGAVIKNWGEKIASDNSAHNEFYGGDIPGITEKLDYIQSLGADIVYITPFFISPSNHKYDTLDHRKIDPSMGSMDDFKNLLSEAHKRNMKILIDLALNHVSNKHPYFLNAISDKNSQYVDYFTFRNYPDEYDCWQGHKSLPEINLQYEPAMEEFITGENSVLRYWLRTGVDGIRLDSANDLGLSVADAALRVGREENPDAVIIGEIFCFASSWTKRLDAVQSYYAYHSIFSLLKNEISSVQFMKNILRIYEDYGITKSLQSLNMIASHDTPRALSMLDNDRNRLFIAITLMFTLPGVPMIYYGEENGMCGMFDPQNRAPMAWDLDNCDIEIHNLYRKLIELRKSRKEIQCGKLIDLTGWLENGVIAFIRHTGNPSQFSLTVINPANERKDFRLFVPYPHFFSELELEDIFSNMKIRIFVSSVEIELEPMQCAVFIPVDGCIGNYSFFKRT